MGKYSEHFKPKGKYSEFFDDRAPIAKPVEQKEQPGLGHDLLTSVGQGIQRLPGMATGLVDIPLGLAGLDRPADKAANYLGEKTGFTPGQWADEADTKYLSQDMQDAKAEVDRVWEDPNAGGFDVAKAYLDNPGVTAATIAQSIPSILGGGVLGKLSRLANPVVRGAAGEGAVIAGQSMDSIDKNVDPQKAAALSLGAGTIGAGIGVLGGKAASRFGVDDINTIAAGGGRVTTPSTLPYHKRVPLAGAIEGAEELGQSVTETGVQNIAEDNPFTQGMARSAVEGTLAGTAMGLGANAKPRGPLSRALGESQPQGTEGLADIAGNGGINPVQDDIVPSNELNVKPGNDLLDQNDGFIDAGKLDARDKELRDLVMPKQQPRLGLPLLPNDEMVTFDDGSQILKSDFVANVLPKIGEEQTQQLIGIINTELPSFETVNHAINQINKQNLENATANRQAPEPSNNITGADRNAGPGINENGNADTGNAEPDDRSGAVLPYVQSSNEDQESNRVQPENSEIAGELGSNKQDSREALPTHEDDTGEQYTSLGNGDYQDANGETWTFDEGELTPIAQNISQNSDNQLLTEQNQQDKFSQEQSLNEQQTAEKIQETQTKTQPREELNEQAIPATQKVQEANNNVSPDREAGENEANLDEQVQVTESNVSPDTQASEAVAKLETKVSENTDKDQQSATQTEVHATQRGVVKAPILTQKKNTYINNQVKAAQLKKGSPGYDNAVNKIKQDYESDLEKAEFSLPFDEFKQLKDNQSHSDSVLKQTYNAVRDELGITNEFVEPVQAIKGVVEGETDNTVHKINKQDYYDAVSSGIFKEVVNNSIQNDGQKLLDAIDNNDLKELKRISLKYQRDAGIAQGGGGSGPGKVKQARHGSAQLYNLAIKAEKELTNETKTPTTNATPDSNGTGETAANNDKQYVVPEEASEEKVTYHPAIESMASDLVEGGGITVDKDNKRNKSLNPGWYKEGAFVVKSADGKKELKTIPSVATVKKAVDDYVAGNKLSKPQARIIEKLDDIARAEESFAKEQFNDEELSFARSLNALIIEAKEVGLDGAVNSAQERGDIDTLEQLQEWQEDIEYAIKDAKEKDNGDSPEGTLTGETNEEIIKREAEQKQRKIDDATVELKAKQKDQADKGVDSLVDDMLGNNDAGDIFGGNAGLTVKDDAGVNNVPNTTGTLEQDEAGDKSLQATVQDTGKSDRQGATDGRGQAGKNGVIAGERDAIPEDRPITEGAESSQQLSSEQPVATESDAGSAERGGGRESGEYGEPNDDHQTTSKSNDVYEEELTLADKVKLQRLVEGKKNKNGDIDNIRETLPVLMPEQQDDVLHAENRLKDHDGFMLTNGTGTGKTFSGLGIIKRFANEGKKNIIIVAPNSKVINDWIKSGKNLLLNITRIKNTGDKGNGIVVTSYENFRENTALLNREYDLLVFDESHKLNSNQAGTSTKAQSQMRMAANLYGHDRKKATAIHDKEMQSLKSNINAEIERLNKKNGESDKNIEIAQNKYEKQRIILDAKINKTQVKVSKQKKSKVLFLSASPFAYHKSMQYADGFLFDSGAHQPRTGEEDSGYNVAQGFDSYLQQTFGYKMRTGLLNSPDADVDTSLAEKNANDELKKSGALSGRSLVVKPDYSREFVLIDDKIGKQIDDGIQFLHEQSEKYSGFSEQLHKRFDYLNRLRLLEALKAHHAIARIKKHHNIGRKVVVFHDYKTGGSVHPFHFSPTEKIKASDIQKFRDERPDLVNLNLSGLGNVISTLTSEFPNALVFNGDTNKADKIAYPNQFNDDNSDANLIIVLRAAGKEGISLHDTTGKNQRVLIDMGLPVRPTDAIQTEGRIYRSGVMTNAITEYFSTGLNYEATAFAQAIAQRSGTAENLAMGHEARDLLNAFVSGYSEPNNQSPSDKQGVGGKEGDRYTNEATQLDQAKLEYHKQQKNSKSRANKEGKDYYATPEPVGLAMTQWADLKPKESALEPSAGHGAIARYFPAGTNNTFIEPSYTLAPQLGLLGNGTVKNEKFEDLNVVNKYDSVIMNPPFGNGGSTAIKHIEKAFNHLRDGGRIIAIVPKGAMDNKLESFMEKTDSAYTVANIQLPSITFKKAGTGVSTQIVIIDKVPTKWVEDGAELPNHRWLDYRTTENITELFDSLDGIEIAERVTKPAAKEDPKFSKSNKKTTKEFATEVKESLGENKPGSTVAQIKELLPRRVKRLLESGNLKVVQSVSDISDKAYSFKNDEGIEGFYDPDEKTIYLVADQLTNENLNATLSHELFHRARATDNKLQKQLSELDKRLQVRFNLAAKGIGTKAEKDAYNRVMDAKTPIENQLEEFQAYLITAYNKSPESLSAAMRKWVKDLFATIRAVLIRNGILPKDISPADLNALAKYGANSRSGISRNENSVTLASKQGYKGNDKGEAKEWLEAVAAGLDMSHAGRMKRAKAMGFDVDTKYYHGSDSVIRAFDPEKLGENTSAPSASKGFFFATNPNVANYYPVYEWGEWVSTFNKIYRKIDSDIDAINKEHDDSEDTRSTLEKVARNVGNHNRKIKSLYRMISEIESERGAGTYTNEQVDSESNRVSKEIYKLKEKATLFARNYPDASNRINKYIKLMDEQENLLITMNRSRSNASGGDSSGEVWSGKADIKELNPNVMPVFLRIKKPFKHDFKGQGYRDISYNELLDTAISNKNDGALFKDTKDPHETDIAVIFDSNQVRSIHAAFDPDNASSSNLLASIKKAGDTTTEQFKKWFANSKMKRNGKPIKFYHGTNADFSVFDREKLGDNTAHTTAGLGHFFTEDKATADKYGDDTHEVYLSIKNPYVVTSETLDKRMGDDAKAFADKLKAKGYDGIYVSDAKYSIAFDSNQVKLTSNESPTSNSDIRFSRASNDKLLAPNGEESNLSKSQYAQVRTAKFKKWFGDWENNPDGKVLDDNGEPLVIYHSGEYGFNEIIKKIGNFGGIFALPYEESNYRSKNYDLFLKGEILEKSDIDDNLPENSSKLFSDLLRKEITEDEADLLIEALEDEADYPLEDSGVWDILQVSEESGAQIEIQKLQGQVADKLGYGSTRIWDEFEGETILIVNPNQIKSATDNNGEFSNDNPNIRFSKAGGTAKGNNKTWRNQKGFDGVSDEQFDTLGKIGKPPGDSFTDKLKAGIEKHRYLWRNKLRQGIVDQFDSFGSVLGDKRAWMMANMSNAGGSVAEAALEFGQPFMDRSGAVDINTDKKSLSKIVEPLGDELDRFLMWIAGNRAEGLKLDGKENLFSDDDISNLKGLADGDIDGKSRQALYNKTRLEFEQMHNAIVKMGVDTGLVSKEDAKLWKDQGFYIPFYRLADESADSHGPQSVSGLVRQQAYKKLKGADMQLDDLLGNTLMNWNHLIGASLKNQAAAKALKTAEQMGLATSVPAKLKGKNSVFIREDGKEQWYNLDESQEGALVLDSLTALNYDGLNTTAMKVMRKFKRALTIGVTASPEFKVANLIRDSIQAVAVADMSAQIHKNLYQGFKATKKDSKTIGRMIAGGGAFGDSGYIHGGDPDAIKLVLEKGIERSTILDTRKGWKKLWDKYQDIGSRLENVNRAANFEQSLAKGDDLLSANFAARDHLDFSRTGSFVAVRALSQMVPFLNARLQGMDKLGRSVTDKKQRKQFIAVVGAYSLISIALYLSMKDDDDYKEAEQWERDTYHLFKLPGSDVMYRIPRPFEVGAIANMLERGVEQMVDDKVHGELFAERLWHSVTETFAMNPTPQLFKPIIETWANKNSFTGRATESQAMQRLSTTERKKAWSSQTAIGISKTMDAILWDKVTLSPVQVEHLVNGYLGWAGATILSGIDTIARPLTGAATQPEKRIEDYPVIGRFVREGKGRNSRFITEFYENKREIDQHVADIKRYRDDQEYDKAREAMQEHKDDIRYRKTYSRAGRKISDINKKIRLITSNKTMSSDTKRRRIDMLNAQRSRVAKQAVERFAP